VFIDAVQFFKPRSSFPTFRRFFLCKEWKAFVKTILHRDSQQTLAASGLRNDNYFFPVTTIVSFQWFRVVVVVGCCSLVWA
jgi:hypothetical protein